MSRKRPESTDEQLRICQQECGARCCRYITVLIKAPRRKADYDEISWFLAHEDISVYVESRRWYLEVRNKCKYLTDDNLCSIYENRPDVCRQYDPDSCEYPKRPRHTLQFDSKQEFDRWWARKRARERRRRKQRARARQDKARRS